VSNTAARAAEKDFANEQAAMAARGFDVGSEASQALANSFAHGFNQMGPNRGLGYNISGREVATALGQLDGRMAQAKAGYGLPAPFGTVLGLMGMANLGNIRSGLLSGYAPAFDKQGQIQGVFGPDQFGFGGLVYSGNPIEGNLATGWSDDTIGGDGADELRPRFAPVNPDTGQCDEGYMFDEDMQACRLDTGYQSAAEGGGAFGQPGDAYARMGLLDVAPTGLPQFQQQYGAGFGSPADFAAANTAFRRQGAYRPEYFDQPYPTTGYTLLS
jgi:hypothetical protein